MRRLPILLILALVITVLALAPVSAEKPNCDDQPDHGSCKKVDPPPTDSFPDCVFDVNDGVLLGWSETGEPYRCVWTPDDAFAEVSFQIQSETVETVKLPQLTVNAEAWTPSDVCFNEWANRPQALPFPPNDSSFWTFSPALSLWWSADEVNTCLDGGPYLFAIRVNPVKGGDVKLVMSPPGELVEGPLDIAEGS